MAEEQAPMPGGTPAHDPLSDVAVTLERSLAEDQRVDTAVAKMLALTRTTPGTKEVHALALRDAAL